LINLNCLKISTIQLNKISSTITKIRSKFSLGKHPIILSGIGQEILHKYLNENGYESIFLKSLLKKSKLNKEASFHAPALCIALLLKDLK